MASDQSIRNFPPDPSACPLFLTFPTSGGGGSGEGEAKGSREAGSTREERLLLNNNQKSPRLTGSAPRSELLD